MCIRDSLCTHVYVFSPSTIMRVVSVYFGTEKINTHARVCVEESERVCGKYRTRERVRERSGCGGGGAKTGISLNEYRIYRLIQFTFKV